jgi:hypothetical protein
MSKYTPEEIDKRRRMVADLVERGLIILHYQDDGTALMEYPEPEHPEIIALFGTDHITAKHNGHRVEG